MEYIFFSVSVYSKILLKLHDQDLGFLAPRIKQTGKIRKYIICGWWKKNASESMQRNIDISVGKLYCIT